MLFSALYLLETSLCSFRFVMEVIETFKTSAGWLLESRTDTTMKQPLEKVAVEMYAWVT